MFSYTCLNPIANVGLDLFSENYQKSIAYSIFKGAVSYYS